MKSAAVLLAAAVLLVTAAIPAQQVTATTGVDKGIVSTDYIVVTATVEGIDQERRTITLKGPDNKVVTLRASKEVKKFGGIKKGDLVSAEYLDAVAVIVRKPDGVSHPGYLREVSVAPRGKESDGLPVDMTEMLGTVEAIDYGLRTITVKTSDGVIQSFKVDKRVKKLKDLLKGDRVHVRSTEPLAVRIIPAKE